MKVIRTYILKEIFLPFILALGVLTSIFLLGNLIKLTNLVINKGVPFLVVSKVFIFIIPLLLGYTLPIACLFAVIVAFSRLSKDNEILALRASGFHISKLLVPLLTLGIVISLFSLILNDRLIPYAHYKQKLLLKNIGIENPTAMLEAGVFIHAFDDHIIFIHKINKNKMENITIYQPQEGKATRTIIAKYGEFTHIPGTDQVKLKLMHGTSDEPNLENNSSFYKLNFKNYFMTLDLNKNNKQLSKKPKSMTLKELRNEIKHFEIILQDKDVARLHTEYLRKITLSFSPILFVLLGFSISVITNKKEKAANILLAILCTTAYYLLSLGSEALAIQMIAPVHIIMWVPTLIGLTIAIILNIKCVS